MTLALTRANSTDPRVLLMAAVEAIRLVLENDGPEEDKIQQRYRLMELEYIPKWLFLASSRTSDEEIMDEEDNFGIGVEWLDVYDKTSRGNQYAFALQDNLSSGTPN